MHSAIWKRPILLFMMTALLMLGGIFPPRAEASPTLRSRIVLVQPDGSRIEAILQGDEYFKLLTTPEGCAIVRDEASSYYCYARFRPDGSREASPWRVSDPRTPASVLSESRQIPLSALSRRAAEKRLLVENIRGRVLSQQRALFSAPTKTPSGPRRVLVLLAQFSDLKFRYSREDFVQLLASEEPTSALSYFEEQFAAAGLHFEIDVAEIVTLPNKFAYYGKNDEEGADTNPQFFVRDACKAADGIVDFSRYDNNGDGQVDNVFLFFAGADESEGAGEDHLWSHQWYLRDGAGISLQLDGVLINSYACTSELTYTPRGSTTLTTIGTFCHEYSHSFGLPDYYDTDYEESGGISEALWQSLGLMDAGNHNNGGQTPPSYNALDRYLLGLIEPRPLQPGAQRLHPISDGGDCLLLETETEGEFFLFECRSNKDGWDAAIGGKGLLIYHIDRSSNLAGNKTASLRWRDNTINCAPIHQCIDLVEADPSISASFENARKAGTVRDLVPRAFFPLESRTAFTPNTQPPFLYWNGNPAPLSLSDIRFDGEDILFTVSGAEPVRIPEVAAVSGDVFQDAAIISWQTDIEGYTGPAWISAGPTGGPMTEYEVQPWSPGQYAWTLEELTPKKAYSTVIYFKSSGSPVHERKFNFTTKSSYTGGRPFIVVDIKGRNADGSFPSGAALPLRVYHLPTGSSVSWSFDGEPITTGGSGYFTPSSSGELKATVSTPDGNEFVLLKSIVIR